MLDDMLFGLHCKNWQIRSLKMDTMSHLLVAIEDIEKYP